MDQAKCPEPLHSRDEFLSIANHELKTPLTSLHLAKERTNLAALCREVTERFRTEATQGAGGVTLLESPPIFGNWDPTRVDQVITNLISNTRSKAKLFPESDSACISPAKSSKPTVVTSPSRANSKSDQLSA